MVIELLELAGRHALQCGGKDEAAGGTGGAAAGAADEEEGGFWVDDSSQDTAPAVQQLRELCGR